MSSADASLTATKLEVTPGSKIALEFLGVTKSEIHIRIRVRDTLLATYAAAAFTAIAAILASPQLGPRFLYGIPYLALAFCLLVSYHHAGIGALGTHCATDLLPRLTRESKVFPFEYSNVFNQYHKKNSTRRSLAHAMILLLPPAITLVVNWTDMLPAAYAAAPQFTFLWVFSFALMIVSFAVIHRSNRSHYEGFPHKPGVPSTTMLDQLGSQA